MPSHPMGHPVMGEIWPRRTAVFIDVVFIKSLLALNDFTYKNNTRIEAFPTFVIVEYQLFTMSFFIKTMQKNIMDFEHPTR